MCWKHATSPSSLTTSPSLMPSSRSGDKCSLRQFNHLDFVAQFTTDIKHISGQDMVADALSRVESVTAPPSYDSLAGSQDDDELQAILGSTTDLRLEKLPIPGTTVSFYCDTSAGKPRPYIPAPLSPQVFRSVHELSNAGTRATASWSQSGLCGWACGRIAAPGPRLTSLASAPRSLAIP